MPTGGVHGTITRPVQKAQGAGHPASLWAVVELVELRVFRLGASFANVINSHSQVVGGTFSCADGSHSRAFLWEKGAIIDLNTLIPADSFLQLVIAFDINDRGEISGIGVPPGVPPANYNTPGHAFLLIPCDQKHAGVEGCDYRLAEGSTAVSRADRGVHNATSRGGLPQLSERRRLNFPFHATWSSN